MIIFPGSYIRRLAVDVHPEPVVGRRGVRAHLDGAAVGVLALGVPWRPVVPVQGLVHLGV